MKKFISLFPLFFFTPHDNAYPSPFHLFCDIPEYHRIIPVYHRFLAFFSMSQGQGLPIIQTLEQSLLLSLLFMVLFQLAQKVYLMSNMTRTAHRQYEKSSGKLTSKATAEQKAVHSSVFTGSNN
ncbi:MAG: hypothetical protein K6A40_09475, partial [Solobacterium sp.]|nr:hypothetical protein [Solobacterium sp.]